MTAIVAGFGFVFLGLWCFFILSVLRGMDRIVTSLTRLENSGRLVALNLDVAQEAVDKVAVDLGVAQGAVDKVASDLGEAQQRADQVVNGEPGEAADAGAQSGQAGPLGI